MKYRQLGITCAGLLFALTACRPLDPSIQISLAGCEVSFADKSLPASDNPIISGGGSGLEGCRRAIFASESAAKYSLSH